MFFEIWSETIMRQEQWAFFVQKFFTVLLSSILVKTSEM